jgi:hypothetical protein
MKECVALKIAVRGYSYEKDKFGNRTEREMIYLGSSRYNER